MKVQVLGIREVGAKGFRVAHVRAGVLFGDVPVAPEITGPGVAVLRVNVICRGGRLVASLRCEQDVGNCPVSGVASA